MATKPEDLFTHRIELWDGGGGGKDEQNEFRLFPGFGCCRRRNVKPCSHLTPAFAFVSKIKNGFCDNKWWRSYLTFVFDGKDKKKANKKTKKPTRMHSSRMHTACSLTVCHARPLPCMPPPCMPPAMHAPLPCTPPAMHAPCHAHPPGQNSWHMLLKILPCPNFIAGGKKKTQTQTLSVNKA